MNTIKNKNKQYLMITSGRDLKNTSCLSYYFCFDWSPEHLRANIHLRHAATKAPACHSKHVTVWRKVLSHDNLCNAVFIMLCRKMRQKKGLIFFFYLNDGGIQPCSFWKISRAAASQCNRHLQGHIQERNPPFSTVLFLPSLVLNSYIISS